MRQVILGFCGNNDPAWSSPRKGQVSSITLPNFVLKKHWQALERCKAQRWPGFCELLIFYVKFLGLPIWAFKGFLSILSRVHKQSLVTVAL